MQLLTCALVQSANHRSGGPSSASAARNQTVRLQMDRSQFSGCWRCHVLVADHLHLYFRTNVVRNKTNKEMIRVGSEEKKVRN